MNDKLKTKAVDSLFDAVLKLKTRDECKNSHAVVGALAIATRLRNSISSSEVG